MRSLASTSAPHTRFYPCPPAGLNLGKDKLKGLVESFGGKVTGSVSGLTNYLVVGKGEEGLQV
jgi:hypothetical protein